MSPCGALALTQFDTGFFCPGFPLTVHYVQVVKLARGDIGARIFDVANLVSGFVLKCTTPVFCEHITRHYAALVATFDGINQELKGPKVLTGS